MIESTDAQRRRGRGRRAAGSVGDVPRRPVGAHRLRGAAVDHPGVARLGATAMRVRLVAAADIPALTAGHARAALTVGSLGSETDRGGGHPLLRDADRVPGRRGNEANACVRASAGSGGAGFGVETTSNARGFDSRLASPADAGTASNACGPGTGVGGARERGGDQGAGGGDGCGSRWRGARGVASKARLAAGLASGPVGSGARSDRAVVVEPSRTRAKVRRPQGCDRSSFAIRMARPYPSRYAPAYVGVQPHPPMSGHCCRSVTDVSRRPDAIGAWPDVVSGSRGIR